MTVPASGRDRPAARFVAAGDCAIEVEYGDRIDPVLHDRVLALDAAVAAATIDGVVETVPTYRSLMVHFDPRRITQAELIERLATLGAAAISDPGGRNRWRLPICYDGTCGEDVAELAEVMGLPAEEVVARHASTVLRLFMYGFAPGCGYLAPLPEAFDVSRRAVPRARAEAGSVLVASRQTVLFSVAMPTGWYVIGRTPERLFDLRRKRPFLFQVGDEIEFERVDAASFARLTDAAADGRVVARRVA